MAEYNEDDYISHYYRKEAGSKPLGTRNDYRATGIDVPSDHPDYQRQYWEKVRKPRLQAERDRQRGLLTVEEAWDVVQYAHSIRDQLEDYLDAYEELNWCGEYRVHNGIRWVFIVWEAYAGSGEWAALVNGQLQSEIDPFGDSL